MTLTLKVGRRVPRHYMKRTFAKMRGLLTFQENLWIIIDRALQLSKKEHARSNTDTKFIKRTFREDDPQDLHYNLEWIEIIFKGRPDQEKEELKEFMQIFKSVKGLFKKDIKSNADIKKPFISSMLPKNYEEAYEKGYEEFGDAGSVAQKLLDAGILIYYDLVEDYNIPDYDDSKHKDFLGKSENESGIQD